MSKKNPYAIDPLNLDGLDELCIEYDTNFLSLPNNTFAYLEIIEKIYDKFGLFVHLVPHPTGEYSMLWSVELVEGVHSNYIVTGMMNSYEQKTKKLYGCDYHYCKQKRAIQGINKAIELIIKHNDKIQTTYY